MRSLASSLLPVALAVLGAVVPLVGGGFTAWGLSIAWLVGIGVVTIGRSVARPAPQTRVLIDLVLLGLTSLALMPLGGWWFVPAVIAQTFLDRGAALAAAEREGQVGSTRIRASR